MQLPGYCRITGFSCHLSPVTLFSIALIRLESFENFRELISVSDIVDAFDVIRQGGCDHRDFIAAVGAGADDRNEETPAPENHFFPFIGGAAALEFYFISFPVINLCFTLRKNLEI